MDAKTFNNLLEAQLERSTSVLLNKADEYATDGDRLHNFKAAALLGGSNLREALGGMMIKHTVSIYDMMNSGKQYPETVWNEKITDHINYLLLLRAVIEDDHAISEPLTTLSNDDALAALKDKLTGTPIVIPDTAPAILENTSTGTPTSGSSATTPTPAPAPIKN
jgi:hypothetical protein